VFLAQWRAWKGLSQSGLGNRIEPPVSKGTVSKWENKSKPWELTLGVLAAYAEAVDRPVADLFHLPPAKDKPAEPSLDAIADQMDEVSRQATIDFVSALAKRRAKR